MKGAPSSAATTALVCTLSLVISGSQANGQIGPQLKKIGRLPDGPVRLVEFETNREYRISGTALEVIDRATSRRSAIVGALDLGSEVGDLAVSDGYVYVTDLTTVALRIIDVREPTVPRQVSRIQFANSKIGGLAVANRLACVWVSSSHEGLVSCYDVGDPSNPQPTGFVTTSYSRPEMAIEGDRLVVAAEKLTGWRHQLEIFDINDPAAPELLGTLQTNVWFNDLDCVGSYVYATDHGFYNDGRHHVIDITDPTEPSVSSVLEMPGFRPVALSVSEGIAHVVGTGPYDGELRLIDIGNPHDPIEVGLLPMNSPVDVEVQAGRAIVADTCGGTRVIDVVLPAVPIETVVTEAPGASTGVTIVGETAYVADDCWGLRVLDLRDPTKPIELGRLRQPGIEGVNATVDHGLAYLAAGHDGVRIIDVRDPSSLRELSVIVLQGQALDTAVSEGIAHVAAWDGALQIFDVTTPTEPRILGRTFWYGHILPIGYALSVGIRGSFTFFGSYGQDGFHVVDTSDPEEPLIVDRLRTGGWGSDIDIVGDLAYVAELYAGLRIVDVGTTFAWHNLSLIDTPGLAVDVAILGHLAYLADKTGGLRAINVGDPTHPVEIATAPTIGPATGVDANHEAICVAEDWAGLSIYAPLQVTNRRGPSNRIVHRP